MVDDRFDWRLRVKREIALLVGNKILIDEYESGENFLKEDQIYDLILLDVEMKGKDGFETAAIPAEKRRQIQPHRRQTQKIRRKLCW